MLTAILLLLILFWLLGYGPFTALNLPLFTIGRESVDLWDVLIFLLVVWLVGLLPSPFREIAVVLLIVWLLSTFGIIAIVALPKIIVIAIIAGLILYILRGV